MREDGCLIAPEQEIVVLDDLAKPFDNMEEMKATSSSWRCIQQ